jgi:CheY-like chemotaxis protein
VTLWLPLADICTADDASPADTRCRADQGAWRVLLVDDDELVRLTLAAQLEAAGMRVVLTPDGPEALALLDLGTPVDFLVTDLSMPGMNGAALIREAQVRRPGLPAILLTGYAGDGAALAVEGAISGAFSLLRKPIQGSQLGDRIAAVLEARTLEQGRPAGRGGPGEASASAPDERAGVSGAD